MNCSRCLNTKLLPRFSRFWEHLVECSEAFMGVLPRHSPTTTPLVGGRFRKPPVEEALELLYTRKCAVHIIYYVYSA